MSVVSETEEGQRTRALFPLRREALPSSPGRGVQAFAEPFRSPRWQLGCR